MTTTTPTPNPTPTPSPQGYDFHPVSNVFPLIKGEEFNAFRKDIETNGLVHPIALFQGKILDGRNRYNACKALLKEPEFVHLPLSTNPIAYVLSANEKRRHLSQSQRALVAAKLASLKLGDNQHSGGKGVSIETASKLLNVGKASVNRCRKVLKLGVPELVQMVEQDEVAASVAEEVAILPKVQQTELVKKGAKEIRRSPSKWQSSLCRLHVQTHSMEVSKPRLAARGCNCIAWR